VEGEKDREDLSLRRGKDRGGNGPRQGGAGEEEGGRREIVSEGGREGGREGDNATYFHCQ
jgi:hypothetical protein